MNPSRFFLRLPVLAACVTIATTVSAQITLMQSGGTFRTDDTNYATGGTAFATGDIGVAPHSTAGLNNGSYGNSSSWIGSGADSAGILFSAPTALASFAFGRDNTGTYSDRTAGTYTFYYTTDTGLNTANAMAANWTSLGSLTYTGSSPHSPALRHLYTLGSTVSNATGFRIDSPSGTAIDEIELYATGRYGASNNFNNGSSGHSSGPNGTLAQRFMTDSSAAQFTLNTLTMQLAGASGVSDFSVQIRADSGSNTPGAVIGTLSGTTAPIGLGAVTFTGDDLILDADTAYWITATFTSSGGGVSYSMTNTATTMGMWEVTQGYTYYNTSTGNWSHTTGDALRFSLEAQAYSAVPEPSTYAVILGLGALGYVAWRRRSHAGR